MSGESVRAILDGRKTQTRRVVKYAPHVKGEGAVALTWQQRMDGFGELAGGKSAAPYLVGQEYGGQRLFCNLIDDIGYAELRCPYGQPGDRLWVRESVAGNHQLAGHPVYRAEAVADDSGERDGWWVRESQWSPEMFLPNPVKWKSPLYMPRWASRLTLEITEVRVQRVQEIDEADAVAEGVRAMPSAPAALTDRTAFGKLWNKLNAKRGYPWDSNPWVWALTFRVVT
jgi:hypothetical protein